MREIEALKVLVQAYQEQKSKNFFNFHDKSRVAAYHVETQRKFVSYDQREALCLS